MLGIFAEYGVYFASLWSFEKNMYQLGAINMFTNYDGKGSSFGDTLVQSIYNGEDISVYSSIDGEDEGKVKIILINRSLHEDKNVGIILSSDRMYTDADVYSLYGDSPVIRRLDGVENIIANGISYTLPALSITEFIVNAKDTDKETEESPSAADGETKENQEDRTEDKDKPFRYIVPAAAAAAALILTAVCVVLIRRRRG